MSAPQMTGPRLFVVLAVALLATTPWPGAAPFVRVFGLPGWAAYSLGMTVVFGIVLFVVIGRFWDRLSERGADDA